MILVNFQIDCIISIIARLILLQHGKLMLFCSATSRIAIVWIQCNFCYLLLIYVAQEKAERLTLRLDGDFAVQAAISPSYCKIGGSGFF
jgi:hypothetical protein